jgi:hypothetical protein
MLMSPFTLMAENEVDVEIVDGTLPLPVEARKGSACGTRPAPSKLFSKPVFVGK